MSIFRARENTDDDDDDDENDDEEDDEEADLNSSGSDVHSDTGSAKNMADFEDMTDSEQATVENQLETVRRSRFTRSFVEETRRSPLVKLNRKRNQNEIQSNSQTSSNSSSSSSIDSTNASSTFITGSMNMDEEEINISNLSAPGQTLLWDLLQEQSQHRLPENLFHETERLFGQVLHLIEDRRILLHFIQASLDNLKKSVSSAVSLRLLPKLFSIFQQLQQPQLSQQQQQQQQHQQQQQRANNHVFLLFEERFHVLNVFFNDLEQLTKRLQNATAQTIHNEIMVRFQFLSCIFSLSNSPKEFRKSR